MQPQETYDGFTMTDQDFLETKRMLGSRSWQLFESYLESMKQDMILELISPDNDYETTQKIRGNIQTLQEIQNYRDAIDVVANNTDLVNTFTGEGANNDDL